MNSTNSKTVSLIPDKNNFETTIDGKSTHL
jgi:hypothetical protein